MELRNRKIIKFEALWYQYEALDEKQLDCYDPKFILIVKDQDLWDKLQVQKIGVLEELTQH